MAQKLRLVTVKSLFYSFVYFGINIHSGLCLAVISKSGYQNRIVVDLRYTYPLEHFLEKYILMSGTLIYISPKSVLSIELDFEGNQLTQP